MDKQEKYFYWEEYAQYDLETAQAMFDTGRYLYSVFMCQQAIEKIVKGVFVLYTGEEPVKTHNIAFIFNNLCERDEFRKNVDGEDSKHHKDEYVPLFVKLLAFYISARYPSYKEKMSAILTNSEAQEILNKTKEAFVWIQSLKKFLV